MDYVGDITSFEPEKGRFRLPVGVLRDTGWTIDESFTLIAGAISLGHIRLYRHAWLTHELAERDKGLRSGAYQAGEIDDRLQLRADRYRKVGFGASDNRVSIANEVAFWLFGDATPAGPTPLFAQSRTEAIDVLTSSVRISRLTIEKAV